MTVVSSGVQHAVTLTLVVDWMRIGLRFEAEIGQGLVPESAFWDKLYFNHRMGIGRFAGAPEKSVE